MYIAGVSFRETKKNSFCDAGFLFCVKKPNWQVFLRISNFFFDHFVTSDLGDTRITRPSFYFCCCNNAPAPSAILSTNLKAKFRENLEQWIIGVVINHQLIEPWTLSVKYTRTLSFRGRWVHANWLAAERTIIDDTTIALKIVAIRIYIYGTSERIFFSRDAQMRLISSKGPSETKILFR